MLAVRQTALLLILCCCVPMATDAFAAASGARKVLCLDPVSTAGQKELQEGGYTVDSRKAVSNEEMDALLASGDYCSVIVRAANTVRAATFDGAKGSLVVVGRAGVGVDNIDLEAAKRAGVTVVNAPNGNTGAVAELTFGLLIAQARNIIAAHRSIAEGKWDKSALLGHSLQGKTLGIVGMGGIGRGVASRALAFGMKVVTPKRKSGSNAPVDGVQVMASLDDVLAVCDYLTLHVPLSDSTRDMIGRDQLAKMKRTAVLINAARGGVVDETGAVSTSTLKY
eukprot:TRINITY_DN997_c0_g1_i3.p1 TRINITY_DN997_c0_g1~~TRINITY_DN997_c0_g1_i3.p1  ORF type:complete len:281 (+),score=80.56 TRINITY_DN997_c0_g1_i3:161-1003(+)